MRSRNYNIKLIGALVGTLCLLLWVWPRPVADEINVNNQQVNQGKHIPKADKPDEFLKYYNEIRTRAGESGPGYSSGYKLAALEKSRQGSAAARLSEVIYDFVERGPGNVPGRTRGLIVDPDDLNHLTYFAGGVGGGIWKTTNGGQSWVHKTDDLPNLAISWIVMAESDHDIIYAGTGEGWGSSSGFIKGSGIYKSTDRGESWSLLSSTAQNDDFQMVNRLVVDPLDPEVVLAATSNDAKNALAFTSGIFKSIDGGATWTKKFSGQSWVQQIVSTPGDFNTLYATVRSNGVFKSTDAGETWKDVSVGLSVDTRIEMAVSPINPDKLFASVVGNSSGTGSDLYISDDAGVEWILATELDGVDYDFLGGQGWYDNTVLAHPFNPNMVYVGGVNLSKFEDKLSTISGIKYLDVREQDTKDFMDLFDFGADFYNGKLDVGDTITENLVSVEVRFGPDGQGGHLKQMAHRYTIPVGEGSGVPAADYSYQDYVEVPFQVWDIDNDRQIMVAFRDQQDDGVFNLRSSNTEDGDEVNHSREYIYISNIEYNATTPDPGMAQNGGHEFRNLYFFWPFLINGAIWDDASLPESKFIIYYKRSFEKKQVVRTTVSDAYGQDTGVNRFFQSTGSTSQQGLHPDHHNIVSILWNPSSNSFQLLVANDGGVYKSDVNSNPGENDGTWEIAGLSYNTSQFYAVDKAPGESRYIGGLQDNGSWMNSPGTEGSSSSFYRRATSGDGFGCAWNHANPNEIITSLYYNDIRKSVNGGSSFASSVSGLTDTGSGNAPFITEIENLHSNPNVLFTVGNSGVWRSEDFGDTWLLASITSQWTLSSSLRARISHASPQIVWAGSHMRETTSELSLHVSTDAGITFNPTNNFPEDIFGSISGMATHPVLDSTAFVLFSFAKGPKILRTDNLGGSWYDISGFGSGTSSTTGFPDVALYDLLVMPHDTTVIWAGTEIGVFESTDAGSTWHILDANIPATSIWDLKVVDDQVVVGTHGRGIWSVTISELPGQVYLPSIVGIVPSLTGELAFSVSTQSNFDSMHVYVDGALVAEHKEASSIGIVEILTNYIASQSGEAYVLAYVNGVPYRSYDFQFSVQNYNAAVDSYENNFEVTSDDFFGFGIKEQSELGFFGRAIHSNHEYESNAFYQYILKSPIRVKAEAALINFHEVVLVESGNTGALPGTPEFKDYVVVQGSKDGVDWVNLLDEYDISSNSDWNIPFINGEPGSSDLYKFRAIDLLDTFEPNDEVLIRFILFSDAIQEGWGWSIDNLRIQTNVIAGISALEPQFALSVYPNPIIDNAFSISVTESIGNTRLTLYDLNGQIVHQELVNINENSSISLSPEIKDGIYNVVLYSGTERVTQKVILQRNR